MIIRSSLFVLLAAIGVSGCSPQPIRETRPDPVDEMLVSYAKSASDAVRRLAETNDRVAAKAAAAAEAAKPPAQVPAPAATGLDVAFPGPWVGGIDEFLNTAASLSGWARMPSTGVRLVGELNVAIPKGRTIREAVLDAAAQVGSGATVQVNWRNKIIGLCYSGCAK